MDSSHPATIMSERVSFSTEEQLSELFGSYKAEWLKERLFDYFTAPDCVHPTVHDRRLIRFSSEEGLGDRPLAVLH